MGIDALWALRGSAHQQDTILFDQIKEYLCRRWNTPEQKIEDKIVGITAKIDYQKPNPLN